MDKSSDSYEIENSNIESTINKIKEQIANNESLEKLLHYKNILLNNCINIKNPKFQQILLSSINNIYSIHISEEINDVANYKIRKLIVNNNLTISAYKPLQICAPFVTICDNDRALFCLNFKYYLINDYNYILYNYDEQTIDCYLINKSVYNNPLINYHSIKTFIFKQPLLALLLSLLV